MTPLRRRSSSCAGQKHPAARIAVSVFSLIADLPPENRGSSPPKVLLNVTPGRPASTLDAIGGCHDGPPPRKERHMIEADGRSGDTRVAVIGTGIMGAAMASNLIAAGLPTTVWDRSPDATAPLAGAGARVAA